MNIYKKTCLLVTMFLALDMNLSTVRADASGYGSLIYLLYFLTPFVPHLGGGGEPTSTPEFVKVFDDEHLGGWNYIGPKGGEYFVTNGVIVCPSNSTGSLFLDSELSDFVLRFEYKLEAGAHNGVALRAPMVAGSPATEGVEIPIVDDNSPAHWYDKPSQRNASIQGIFPAERGPQLIGYWNYEQIKCVGRHYEIKLNGWTILSKDLNEIHDSAILGAYPGFLRSAGHIGFIGHSGRVEFRKIYLKVLSVDRRDNHPPKGFKALFNGKNLNGWKGSVKDPPTRAKMTKKELAAEQEKANEEMRKHWMAFPAFDSISADGKGQNLCTKKNYGNFELQIDWIIWEQGNGKICLRGCPAVQIWETNSPGQFTPPDGSGGLYANEKGSRHPLKFADKSIANWNQFRILMLDGKVHVFLNDELVVNNETLENYWERDKPIYPAGPIEFQNSSGRQWFKSIYIREIPRE